MAGRDRSADEPAPDRIALFKVSCGLYGLSAGGSMIHRTMPMGAVGCLILAACATPPPPSTQIVLLGESFASGADAVAEVNIRIANADASGCDAISVGGYGASAEGLVIGVPVLVDCPLGTRLNPDGTPAP